MKRFCLALLLAAGCSNNFVDDVVPLPFDASVDLTLPREASFPDAPFDAPEDTTKYNGGGPFLCEGCICNGTIDLCYFGGGGGGAPIAGDAGEDADASPFDDAGICSDEAGPQSCVQIPVQCLPNPTCECLAQTSGCACTVDPSGNGFFVTCPPKP